MVTTVFPYLLDCAPIAALCTVESCTWLLHVICKPAESRIDETFFRSKKVKFWGVEPTFLRGVFG